MKSMEELLPGSQRSARCFVVVMNSASSLVLCVQLTGFCLFTLAFSVGPHGTPPWPVPSLGASSMTHPSSFDQAKLSLCVWSTATSPCS